jgi:hypothetical protein
MACPFLTTGIVYYIRELQVLQMKKFFLGIFIGVVLILLFTYLGGGSALKIVGEKTIEVGERVEVYEQALKDATQGLLTKKGEGTKETPEEKDIKK